MTFAQQLLRQQEHRTYLLKLKTTAYVDWSIIMQAFASYNCN